MDATLADPLVGHLLDGRYRVESRIARGGMATVYVATDTRLDRTVALKIMHRELASDADFVRRFIGEAKSVARLSHPNVVGVFDQGSDGEHLYLAMEYVPGRTLRDLLGERGRLPPAEALDVMVPVLAGLGAAHQAGFVHRDVKPENVLITVGNRVKVVDFGLARAIAAASHTKTGMVIGTVAYLAPEQVSSATADARSDVYAAGVMLFELVTGRQPHTADTPLAVAYKHVNETVPAPSSIVPGLPQALDDLLAAATSRDPGRRPADAGQLLHAVFETRRHFPGGSAFAVGADMHTPGPPRQPWQQPPAGAPLAPPPPGQGPPGAPLTSQPRADGQAPQQPGIFGGPGAGALPAFGTGSQQGGTSLFEDAPPMSGYRAEFFGPPAARSDNAFFGSPAPQAASFGPPAAQSNNTLIVSRGGAGHGPRPRRGLADWLFSRRAAYVAGGLAVVVLASLIVWWQASGRYTRVPDVAGLATSTAATELRNLGFQVKIGNPQVDNQVPKGEAARTVPGSGSHALNGATITVIPSAGPRMILVPNVTGQAVANAQKALQAAGLTPGAVQQETSPTVPQNEVISTDPAAGTSWPQTKPVKLTVSAGIGLPDFSGQPRQVAEQWLQQHQLQVQEQQQNSTSQPQDNVIKQSPAANSPITQGEVVTLYISTGPPIVQIPDVTGMSVPDATKQLQALGFQVSVVGFGHGKVIAFQPTGQAPKGATITLLAGPGGG
jgi:beta-lactam-binding protein with PASTA domain/tRNA A-37 threonylcarbamoyl transferase component Bud32